VKTAVFNKETVADTARWIGVDGFACAAAWLMWMFHASAGMRLRFAIVPTVLAELTG
jgi:hypothetical protein